MSLYQRTLLLALLAMAGFVSVSAHADSTDPDAGAIARLIKQLGSSDFEERQKAADALEDIGKAALPALRKVVGAEGDPEARASASKIAASIEAVLGRGEAFTDEVLRVTEVISNKYVVEIEQRELVGWALRGLYEECKRKPSADLEARLGKPESDLKALLRDGRIALKNPKEIEGKKDVEVAIDRILGHLDPRSRYIDQERSWRMLPQLTGVGLKLSIDSDTQMLRIVTPLRDGPAHKAGVRADDLMTHIVRDTADGKQERLSTKGMAVAEAQETLLGPNGTMVQIVVERAGNDKPLEITMVRGRVIPESVFGSRRKPVASWEYLIDRHAKIAYVRLTSFSEATTDQLTQAFKQFEKEGVQGLVFDLRFNLRWTPLSRPKKRFP
jgi:hypothetical protein